MPLKTAIWVPGTAARVEYPERLTWRPPVGANNPALPPNLPLRDITIVGSEITFSQQSQSTGDNTNWFHFPIPTPVLLNDQRVQLLQVFVFYLAQRSEIVAVHIWDGPNRVFDQNNLSHEGEHLSAIDNMNTFPLLPAFDPPLPVFFGINISVQVEFLSELQAGVRSIVSFSTVGADFITP